MSDGVAPGSPGPEARASHDSGAVPPWFRALVWECLLGAACPLLPLPFVDDMALARVRRSMVRRIAAQRGVTLDRRQVTTLAGVDHRSGFGRLAVKAAIYPFRKVVRKLLYFLAIKESLDTFSRLFHQGYLLRSALVRGAVPPGPGDPARVAALANAVHGTLEAIDTRPLGRMVLGVFRNSKRLARAALRWIAGRLRGGAPLEQLEAAGEDSARLSSASPEAELLLDRLLLALWGDEGYRLRLEAELAQRLDAAAGPASAPPA